MIEVILNKLMELLGSLNELGKDRRDLKDRALRAVSIALIETQKYYADLERGSGSSNCEVLVCSGNPAETFRFRFGHYL